MFCNGNFLLNCPFSVTFWHISHVISIEKALFLKHQNKEEVSLAIDFWIYPTILMILGYFGPKRCSCPAVIARKKWKSTLSNIHPATILKTCKFSTQWCGVLTFWPTSHNFWARGNIRGTIGARWTYFLLHIPHSMHCCILQVCISYRVVHGCVGLGVSRPTWAKNRFWDPTPKIHFFKKI